MGQQLPLVCSTELSLDCSRRDEDIKAQKSCGTWQRREAELIHAQGAGPVCPAAAPEPRSACSPHPGGKVLWELPKVWNKQPQTDPYLQHFSILPCPESNQEKLLQRWAASSSKSGGEGILLNSRGVTWPQGRGQGLAQGCSGSGTTGLQPVGSEVPNTV